MTDFSKGEWQTRDGRKARVLCTDAPGSTPMIALVDGLPARYRADGRYIGGESESIMDLFPVPAPAAVGVPREWDVWLHPNQEDSAHIPRKGDAPDEAWELAGWRKIRVREVGGGEEKTAALEEIRKLKLLIHHASIHSGYPKCGYQQMTTEQKDHFDAIVAEDMEALPQPAAPPAVVALAFNLP